MKIKYFVLLFIVIAAANSTFSQALDKNEQAFKALIKQMTDAQVAYDAAALDKILTSNYIEISPLGEFDPREKVMGFYTPEAKAAAAKMSVSLETTEYSIRSYNELAVVVARFNYTLVNDGKPLPPRSMRATIVLRKEKGVLKIASAHYSGIRTAQPSPPKPQ